MLHVNHTIQSCLRSRTFTHLILKFQRRFINTPHSHRSISLPFKFYRFYSPKKKFSTKVWNTWWIFWSQKKLVYMEEKNMTPVLSWNKLDCFCEKTPLEFDTSFMWMLLWYYLLTARYIYCRFIIWTKKFLLKNCKMS
jgi:hypothetical protein